MQLQPQANLRTFLQLVYAASALEHTGAPPNAHHGWAGLAPVLGWKPAGTKRYHTHHILPSPPGLFTYWLLPPSVQHSRPVCVCVCVCVCVVIFLIKAHQSQRTRTHIPNVADTVVQRLSPGSIEQPSTPTASKRLSGKRRRLISSRHAYNQRGVASVGVVVIIII